MFLCVLGGCCVVRLYHNRFFLLLLCSFWRSKMCQTAFAVKFCLTQYTASRHYSLDKSVTRLPNSTLYCALRLMKWKYCAGAPTYTTRHGNRHAISSVKYLSVPYLLSILYLLIYWKQVTVCLRPLSMRPQESSVPWAWTAQCAPA